MEAVNPNPLTLKERQGDMLKYYNIWVGYRRAHKVVKYQMEFGNPIKGKWCISEEQFDGIGLSLLEDAFKHCKPKNPVYKFFSGDCFSYVMTDGQRKKNPQVHGKVVDPLPQKAVRASNPGKERRARKRGKRSQLARFERLRNNSNRPSVLNKRLLCFIVFLCKKKWRNNRTRVSSQQTTCWTT